MAVVKVRFGVKQAVYGDLFTVTVVPTTTCSHDLHTLR